MRLKSMRPESMLAQRPRQHATACPAPQQSGFALVAAMFVIIIIALVIAAMMRMAGNQHGTNSLAIQQARAYQAARAGLDFGISRVAFPARVVNAPCLAAPANTTLTMDAGSNLAEFNNLVVVSFTLVSYLEDGSPRCIYTLTATAQNGVPGTRPDYAYRRLNAVVEN
jgi:MSHA biogenesis protein MshP